MGVTEQVDEAIIYCYLDHNSEATTVAFHCVLVCICHMTNNAGSETHTHFM